jgi:glycosyltransferase involved in cell wall biosynthesis
MSPVISIIVPIYKTEQYLQECVESIIAQTFSDFELILVNDGSPHGAAQEMERLANADSRIRYISQENGGLPSARNAGLALARGEFIGFVDSDDWIAPGMLSDLHAAIVESAADFAMCDYVKVGPSGSVARERVLRGGFFDRQRLEEEVHPQCIMDDALEGPDILSVWCCLYRRSFLDRHGIRFDAEVKYSEDYLFSAAVALTAERFVYLKGHRHYFYRSNPESISQTIKDDSWAVYIRLNEALELLVDQYVRGDVGIDFGRQLDLHILYFALNLADRVVASSECGVRKRELLGEIMQSQRLEAGLSRLALPEMSIHGRLRFLMLRVGSTRGFMILNEVVALLRRLR